VPENQVAETPPPFSFCLHYHEIISNMHAAWITLPTSISPPGFSSLSFPFYAPPPPGQRRGYPLKNGGKITPAWQCPLPCYSPFSPFLSPRSRSESRPAPGREKWILASDRSPPSPFPPFSPPPYVYFLYTITRSSPKGKGWKKESLFFLLSPLLLLSRVNKMRLVFSADELVRAFLSPPPLSPPCLP